MFEQKGKSNGHVYGHKRPKWLRYLLVTLITINMITYVVVSILTLNDISDKIEDIKKKHRVTREVRFGMLRDDEVTQDSNSDEQSATEKQHYDDPKMLHELEHRKTKVIIGASLEILIDLIDLIDIFISSIWIHLSYAILKLISIGMWTFTQADLGISAWWFVPICLGMIITVIILGWFTEWRKWALALLIVFGHVAWILILLIRIEQINFDIEYMQQQISQNIEKPKETKKIILIGTCCMLILDTFGLLVIFLANFWTCLVFAILHLTGILLWLYYIFNDEIGLDHLFAVPLVYAVLIWVILLIYIFNLPPCSTFIRASTKTTKTSRKSFSSLHTSKKSAAKSSRKKSSKKVKKR